MNNTYYSIILVISLFFVSCQQKPTEWVITNHGAVADSATINTLAIQKAIDECHTAGGGTVTVPAGNFITGTILLKDSVHLYLAKGAKLIGSDNPNDYQTIDAFVDATGQARGKCLIGSQNATNISITGQGIIDGRGDLFKAKPLKATMKRLSIPNTEFNKMKANRPFLLRFVGTKKIKITGVELRQSAAWALHFFQCSKILVEKITIYNHAYRNNDGIDLDSSSDAIVRNCTIDSGDDAICLKSTSPVATNNITVSNCTLKSDWGAIKLGTESMGDMTNINFDSCFIHDTRGGGIKILSVDGANINKLKISNIQMERVDMPIFIRLGERLRTYRNAPKQAVGTIKNIEISNITATTRSIANSRIAPPTGIFITGTPNHKVGNVSLSNIQITLPGEGTLAQADSLPQEFETKYPEFTHFGVLPVYGLLGRHIESLTTEKLTFQVLNTDERPEIKLIDTTQPNK